MGFKHPVKIILSNRLYNSSNFECIGDTITESSDQKSATTY